MAFMHFDEDNDDAPERPFLTRLFDSFEDNLISWIFWIGAFVASVVCLVLYTKTGQNFWKFIVS